MLSAALRDRSRFLQDRDPQWAERVRAALRATDVFGDDAIDVLLAPFEPADVRASHRERITRQDAHVACVHGVVATWDDTEMHAFARAVVPALAPAFEQMWADAPHAARCHDARMLPTRAPHDPDGTMDQRARLVAAIIHCFRGHAVTPELIGSRSAEFPDVPWYRGFLMAVIGTALSTDDSTAAVVRDELERRFANDPDALRLDLEHVIGGPLVGEPERGMDRARDALADARANRCSTDWLLLVVPSLAPATIAALIDDALNAGDDPRGGVLAVVRRWLAPTGSARPAEVDAMDLATFRDLLRDPGGINALRPGHPEADEDLDATDVALAMTAQALLDVAPALETIATILDDHDDDDIRAVALRVLVRLDQPEPAARLIDRFIQTHFATISNDLRAVALTALDQVLRDGGAATCGRAIAAQLASVPGPESASAPIGWPPAAAPQGRVHATRLATATMNGDPEVLAQIIADGAPHTHAAALDAFVGATRRDGATSYPRLEDPVLGTVLHYAAHRRPAVVDHALRVLSSTPITPTECAVVRRELRSTSRDRRRLFITRLLAGDDALVLSVVDDLLTDDDPTATHAAIEIIDQLQRSNRAGEACAARIERLQHMSQASSPHDAIARLTARTADPITFDDALGLSPPALRTPLIEPVPHDVVLQSDAGRRCLDAIIIRMAECALDAHFDGPTLHVAQLDLQDAAAFPNPPQPPAPCPTWMAQLPGGEAWREWIAARAPEDRDDDALEFVRAFLEPRLFNRAWRERLPYDRPTVLALCESRTLRNLLRWCVCAAAAPETGVTLLRAYETTLARVLETDAADVEVVTELSQLMNAISAIEQVWPDVFDESDRVRLGRLGWRAFNLPGNHFRSAPDLAHFVAAYDAGMLNDADVALLMLRTVETTRATGTSMAPAGRIRELTTHPPPPAVAARPSILAVVDRARDRILELEMQRGDAPTPLSMHAWSLRTTGGAANLVRLVAALGSDAPERDYENSPRSSRRAQLSSLIARTHPRPGDDLSDVADAIAAHAIPRTRWIEIAMLAPQWSASIETMLDEPGLDDVVWWMHAHCRDADPMVDEQRRAVVVPRLAERTALDLDDLAHGAADVAWFSTIIDKIGASRWRSLAKAATYATATRGTARATSLANTLLGIPSIDELETAIDAKRTQNALLAFALVPLPDDASARSAELRRRYERINRFREESVKAGAQRRVSERRAAEHALSNLARNAGHDEVLPFTWMMERHLVDDLANGPIELMPPDTDTTITLAIDDVEGPCLCVEKKGRLLKDVPAALRSHPEIAALRDRARSLRAQTIRMRQSLEDALRCGQSFDARALHELATHPLARPLLERLVIRRTSDGATGRLLDGGTLRTVDDAALPLHADDRYHLAHPLELHATGELAVWQIIFADPQLRQPFRQIFRETYTIDDEPDPAHHVARRFHGTRLHIARTIRVLRTRGWLFDPDHGLRRVDRRSGVRADLDLRHHIRHEAEPLEEPIHGVVFHQLRHPHAPWPLAELPPIVYSEVMRDIDLVTQAAAAETPSRVATPETIAHRRAIVHALARQDQLTSVECPPGDRFAHVTGTLTTYRIDLGNASVRTPHDQVLLFALKPKATTAAPLPPFLDDDPILVEILRNATFFANDRAIRDRDLIAQIEHRG